MVVVSFRILTKYLFDYPNFNSFGYFGNNGEDVGECLSRVSTTKSTCLRAAVYNMVYYSNCILFAVM